MILMSCDLFKTDFTSLSKKHYLTNHLKHYGFGMLCQTFFNNSKVFSPIHGDIL